jgi:S1-C subfamily serine protease
MCIGSGSGVIINSGGYIVTNNHVIDNADDIEVTLDEFVKYLENRKGGVMLEGIYEDFPGT